MVCHGDIMTQRLNEELRVYIIYEMCAIHSRVLTAPESFPGTLNGEPLLRDGGCNMESKLIRVIEIRIEEIALTSPMAH